MPVKESLNVDDSDLQDLLEESSPESPKSTTSAKASSSKAQSSYSNYYNSNINNGHSSSSLIFRLPELMCYLLTSFLLKCPSLGKIGVIAMISFLVYALVTLTGSSQSIGVIKYDFSSIHSQYDFDIGKIDHWCVAGGDKCNCPDPLHATPRLHRAWHKAVDRHKRMIVENPNPDVAFVGQTLIEALNGRINGNDMRKAEFFGRINHIFTKKFGSSDRNVQKQNPVQGIAMGLTGDHSSHVLWRLMNGELHDLLNPKIWWLVLGMEDIGRYGCSEEITVMGVLRIVEEIKKKRPQAKIVVNSLLPMIQMRMEVAEDEEEFIDAERGNGKGPKPKKHTKHKKHKDNDKQPRFLAENGDIEGKLSKDLLMDRKRQHALEKMRRKYENEVKHDKFNPSMKDVKKWKKKGRHPEKKIPMWSAIHEINKSLHSFCKGTKHVSFFDATPIFTQETEKGKVLISDLISPRGHPTWDGFRAWLEAIEKQTEEWKKKIVHAETHHANDEQHNWFLNSAEYYENLDDEYKDDTTTVDQWYPEDHKHGDSGEEITESPTEPEGTDAVEEGVDNGKDDTEDNAEDGDNSE